MEAAGSPPLSYALRPCRNSAAAAATPNWVMLEPFVFRRDKEESFPDDSEATVTLHGTTSWNAVFRVAFCLVKPPSISRIYAHLPGFPPPTRQVPLAILATHHHVVLFRVAHQDPTSLAIVQDFFIYSTDNPSSPLTLLPPCTYSNHREGEEATRRLLTVGSMGLLCRGKQFAVAELKLVKLSRSKVYADICFLLSSHKPEWKSMRLSIRENKFHDDDTLQLCSWQTDTVIALNHWMCWIDYDLGILFCDVFREPAPTVTFLRFPLDGLSSSMASSWLYSRVSAINASALKFVNIARDDGIGYGPLKPGAGFTITCHTLTLTHRSDTGSMAWVSKEDYKATSLELWDANPKLPRDILMFPQVNIETPNVVHFLMISGFRYVMKKMFVVAIDMKTKTVQSFNPYINGKEGLGTEDADLTRTRSCSPMPFLPCEFSKFLHSSRKMKDM